MIICKHMRNVRSSQTSISTNSCTELSKTQLFSATLNYESDDKYRKITIYKRRFFLLWSRYWLSIRALTWLEKLSANFKRIA